MEFDINSILGLIFGGTGTAGVIALIANAISSRKLDKKNKALVASGQTKDEQIENLVSTIGVLINLEITKDLASKMLTPETKTLLLSLAEQGEKLSGIKINAVSSKALALLKNSKVIDITEEQEAKINEGAAKAQTIINGVQKVSAGVVDALDSLDV